VRAGGLHDELPDRRVGGFLGRPGLVGHRRGPTESDIACIGAGWSVELPDGGAVTVKGLKTASQLFLRQSSLTILNSQIQGAATAAFFVDEGSSITIGGGTGYLTLDGGALAGSGDVYGSVSGASSISAGDPGVTGVGVLTVHGNLILDATSVPVDLSGDGKVPGIGHDRIAVTGSLATTANTVVDVLAGVTFAPVAHTTISPFTASSVSGTPYVNVPDYGGTGTYLAATSDGAGLDVYVTDCDPWVYGPYGTYTSSLAGKDLRLCQLYTSSFAGVDLTSANLSQAVLWDASFAGADLTGADLTRAQVGGADLSTATLTGLRSGSTQGLPILPAGWAAIGGYLVGPGADLTGADLAGLDLSGFDLTGATLTGADLTGTDLTGALLARVRSGGVVGTPATLPVGWQLRSGFLAGLRADFTGADLAGVDLSGLWLDFADFTGANVEGTNLTSSLARVRSGATVGTPSALPANWHIRGGFLVGPAADLEGKTLTGTDLRNVDLSQATFNGATLVDVALGGSNWTQTATTGIKGKNVSGVPAVMAPGLVIVSGYFIGATVNLSGEALGSINLTNRNLEGANLANASISAGNLTGLNLRSANLSGATITNSIVDGLVMTGANLGGLPIGATFGSGLRYAGTSSPMTAPAGWVVNLTAVFPAPRFNLLRQS
jgi:uncharacterized protein YjbI with pentapeptide repeats